MERAVVRWGNEREPRPWDPQTGTVQLPKGRRSIEILGGRFGEWRQPTDLEIDVHPGMAALEVPLRPWRMILGRITRAGDGPSVPAAAFLRPIDSTGEFIEDEKEECVVALGQPSDGWFSFGRDHELEPGTYEVAAAPWPCGPARVSHDVLLCDEAVTVELVLPASERSDGVLLTVLDPDGRPHEPEQVTLDVRDVKGGGGSGTATLESLGDGTYWVPTLLPGYSRQDPIEVTLWVRSWTYGESRVDVPVKRGGAPVIIRYAAPAELHLTVGNRHEWLQAGGVVDVSIPVGAGARQLRRTELSSDGVATLRGLQPGDVHVCLVRNGGDGLSVGLARLKLRSGENRVSMPAPSLHSLRVLGASNSVVIRATDGSGTHGAFWSVQPGNFVTYVPPGTYEVRSGSRTATVEIPGVSEVTLPDPQPK